MTEPPQDPQSPPPPGPAGAPPPGPAQPGPAPQYPTPPQYPAPPQDPAQYPAQYPAQPYPPQPQYPGQQYPPPPYAQYPMPPAGPPAATTNGLAIAALVTGIFGFVLVSIPLAWAGLRKIKRTGQRGRGLAITGLVFSGLWIVLLTGIGITVAVIVDKHVDRDDSGVIVESGWMFVGELHTGDCTADEGKDTDVFTLRGVPCDEPHRAEVLGIIEVDGSSYPSDAAFDAACERRLQSTVGRSKDPSVGYSWISPTREGWDSGDKDLVCFVVTDTPQTGSVTD